MKKTLLLIDLQSDFCKGGELAVPNGDDVITVANRLMTSDNFHTISSQDWHSAGHKSFATNHKDKKPYDLIDLNGLQQTLWTEHCIAGTKGADFHKNLLTGKISAIFRKGTDIETDSYSAFFDNAKHNSTGLAGYLKELKVEELYLMGLATDFCVKFSVLDALELGFKVSLITDGCKAVNLNKGDDKRAIDEMVKSGAALTTSTELLK